MGCQLPNREKFIRDYAEGKLSYTEAESFSDHYFNCDDCFNEVALYQNMESVIAQKGPELFPQAHARFLKKQEPFSEVKAQLKEKVSSFHWGWIAGPVAAGAAVLATLAYKIWQKQPVE